MLRNAVSKQEQLPITRDSLGEYLKDLGKEFRRLNGTKTPAEIVLIGGAAILAIYGFRNLTYGVDAIIVASSAMKDAIKNFGDKHGLPHGWLNTDFKRTASYSDKLLSVSVYYRTFSNILTVRIIAAEYLLAMKLMSGRLYKNDLSDIVGVLWEHQKNGEPLMRKTVESAFGTLYGTDTVIPETSRRLLDAIFADGNYEALYQRTRDTELESREFLLEFEQKHPKMLKNESIDGIIERMKQNRYSVPKKDPLLSRLQEAKREAEQSRQNADIRSKKENEIE